MMDRAMVIDLLIQHESLQRFPYVDTVGKITIGCGRNLTDVGISVDEALALLDHDLDQAVADCATFSWFAGLSAARQVAVVDLRFNVGPAGLRSFKQLLAALARGDYQQASQAMLQSKWARQVGQRAITLATMMATGNPL